MKKSMLLKFSMLFLVFSNILALNSESYMFMWMLMELNMICFVNLLLNYKEFNKNFVMSYFLIQVYNSFIFLSGMFNIEMGMKSDYVMILVYLSLLAKLGLPPFMIWYYKFMKNLKCWMVFFIMACLQKFIPLLIINMLLNEYQLVYNYLILLILFYLTLMVFFGVKINDLRLLMSVSSIIQTTWIMILMIFLENMWIWYYLFYSILNYGIMIIFKFYNMNYISDTYKIYFFSKLTYYILKLYLFSLAGLPPTMGFMIKLMYFYGMIKMNMFLVLMLILNSSVSTFFYLRISQSSYFFFFNTNNMFFKNINFWNFNFKVILLFWLLNLMMMLIYMILW